MKIDQIKPRVKKRKRIRVGRGIAAGRGKTAGRGTKGQKSRTGRGKLGPGFEGGQNPLIRRLPKLRGMGNLKPRNKDWAPINISALVSFKSEKISKKDLIEGGYIRRGQKIKLLGDGEIDKAIEIEVDAVSAAAREKLEKAGGKIIIKSKIRNPKS